VPSRISPSIQGSDAREAPTVGERESFSRSGEESSGGMDVLGFSFADSTGPRLSAHGLVDPRSSRVSGDRNIIPTTVSAASTVDDPTQENPEGPLSNLPDTPIASRTGSVPIDPGMAKIPGTEAFIPGPAAIAPGLSTSGTLVPAGRATPYSSSVMAVPDSQKVEISPGPEFARSNKQQVRVHGLAASLSSEIVCRPGVVSEGGSATTNSGALLGVGGTGIILTNPADRFPHSASTVGTNPFEVMDLLESQVSSRAGGQPCPELSVGYQDSSLGYIELRAHQEPGGVHASLIASSASSEILSGQVGSLSGWLADRHVAVESLHVVERGVSFSVHDLESMPGRTYADGQSGRSTDAGQGQSANGDEAKSLFEPKNDGAALIQPAQAVIVPALQANFDSIGEWMRGENYPGAAHGPQVSIRV